MPSCLAERLLVTNLPSAKCIFILFRASAIAERSFELIVFGANMLPAMVSSSAEPSAFKQSSFSHELKKLENIAVVAANYKMKIRIFFMSFNFCVC